MPNPQFDNKEYVMKTVHEHVYGQDKNIQCEAMGWFIRQARERFNDSDDDFHISVNPVIELPLQSPLDEPVMLADGYRELGLWIPANNDGEVFTGILLAWADDTYPTPESIQYVYLTTTGHVVMARDAVKYNHIKDRTLEEVLTEVIF